MSNMSYEQNRRVAYSLYGPRDSSTASCPLAAPDHLTASVEIRIHVTDARTGAHVGRYPTMALCASTSSIMQALAPFMDAGLVPQSVHCKPEGDMNVHLDFASLECVLDAYVRSWTRWRFRPDTLTVHMHRTSVEPEVAGYDSSDDESFVEVPSVEGLSITE